MTPVAIAAALGSFLMNFVRGVLGLSSTVLCVLTIAITFVFVCFTHYSVTKFCASYKITRRECLVKIDIQWYIDLGIEAWEQYIIHASGGLRSICIYSNYIFSI